MQNEIDEYNNTISLCDNLGECASLEGTEVGEYWALLADIGGYQYVMSEKFLKAFREELIQTVADIETNYKKVERKVTSETTVVDLEYIGEDY